MKSINVNVVELVQNLKGERPMTKPVGYCADQHGTVFTLFVATDRDSQQVITSKDGKRVKLNIRKSLNQPEKEQAAAEAPATPAAAAGLDLSTIPY